MLDVWKLSLEASGTLGRRESKASSGDKHLALLDRLDDLAGVGVALQRRARPDRPARAQVFALGLPRCGLPARAFGRAVARLPNARVLEHTSLCRSAAPHPWRGERPAACAVRRLTWSSAI
eukprot:1379099-Prymnesium_polylepis.1